MVLKRFGCTTIHNKALYKCIIHSFFPSKSLPLCFILRTLTDLSISDFQKEELFDFYAVIYALNVNSFLSYMG